MLPMMVSSCPRCGDSVSVPVSVGGGTTVRCPLCSAEYDLSEILAKLPPALEIVSVPDSSTETSSAAAGLAAAGIAGGSAAATGGIDFGALSSMDEDSRDEHAGEHADDAMPSFAATDDAGPGAFDFAASDSDADAGGGTAVATAAATGIATGSATDQSAATTGKKVRRAPKPKKPKNVVLEILKIVGGGVVGLTVAYLFIWWFPWWPDDRRDPVGLAPKLPGFISFLAPSDLRNPPVEDSEPGEADDQNSGKDNQTNGNRQRSEEDDFLDEPFGFPGHGGNTPVPGVQGGSNKNDNKKPGGRKDGPNKKPDDKETAGGQPVNSGVIGAPSFTSDELGAALLAAVEADQAWDMDAAELSGDDRTAADGNWYKAMCELGRHITYVDTGDTKQLTGRRQAVEDLLLDIGGNREKLLILLKAKEWINFEERPTDGILLAGKARSIEKKGPLFHTELRLIGKDAPTVLVLNESDPKTKFESGDNVIMLGTVIDRPSENIGGYTGQKNKVVWSGTVVKLQ